MEDESTDIDCRAAKVIFKMDYQNQSKNQRERYTSFPYMRCTEVKWERS